MAGENTVVSVLANFGFEAQVMDESGNQYRCIVKRSLGRLVVGDQVQAKLKGDELILLKLLARRSLVTRQIGKTLHKRLVIASNLDYIAMVCSPVPMMQEAFFDAIIIAARQQNIQPLLLLNKSDLPEFSMWQDYMREYYHHSSFEMLAICSLQTNSLAQLEQKISGKRTLFIGASGVGKSTLLNALLGDEYAKTQQLTNHAQGKHTTSNSICYHLDASTQIIDMPGIRSFNLSSLENIEAAYPDISPYLGQCQFRDCQHDKEPNCALLQALEEGGILAERLESYLYFKSMVSSAK